MAEKAENIVESEIVELRRRLEEAEDTLHAIRTGEVDALVIGGPDGEVIYTLTTADYPYRLMIDEMNQ
jgi:diacylglycerol kinase family enzyme